MDALDNNKASVLRKELQQFKQKKQKDNKKLAKEIASWLDIALNKKNTDVKESIDDINVIEDEDASNNINSVKEFGQQIR